MRNIFLGIWFVLIASLYFSNTAFGQVDNIADLLRGGVEDANILVNEYLRPVGNGFGVDLNNGWYSTARTHKFLGFDITVMGTAAIAPTSAETFDLKNLGLKNIRPLNPNNSRTPTAVGADQEGPQVEIFVSNPLLPGGEVVIDTLTMPQGVGFRYVPSPMIQAAVGVLPNTEVMLRFFPEVEINDDFGKVKMFGLGVKHNVGDFLGGLLPVDLAVMAAFTTFQAQTNLNLEPEAGLMQTGANYNNQQVEIEATSVTFNVIASKKFGVITFFGSVGIESADVNLKLKGTYPVTLIDDDPGSPTFGEPAIKDFEDPIKLSFKNPNDTRATIGVQLHLVFLAIHGSYTFAKYPGVNVGVGINIR
ncbi:MAG: hypothetical protein E2O77_10370 [Caldithrix sp.]|nr:MAG: hypothetical protein E2O77_10370 [Caldithrix sp.]